MFWRQVEKIIFSHYERRMRTELTTSVEIGTEPQSMTVLTKQNQERVIDVVQSQRSICVWTAR
jgi:hypothetical protein